LRLTDKMREQRVVLEHHAEAALFGRQRVYAPLVQPDAAVRQRHQAGHAIERGRLAAARGAQQRDEFAALYGQREFFERVGAAKAAAHAVQAQLPELVFRRGPSRGVGHHHV
jgi:hypothetical protein